MNMWQPIETAPKDGTIILGFDDGVIAEMEWRDDGDLYVKIGWRLSSLSWADESSWSQPTHWMQRPQDPE